jgi:Bacterial RNA polymerase, alpha chain C terminal domain
MEPPEQPAAPQAPDPSAVLALPIEELNLPLRAYNSLRKDGVATIADLVARTPQQLLEIENIGPASVEEIRQRLAGYGLTLSHASASANGSAAAGTALAAGPAPVQPPATPAPVQPPATPVPASTAPASTAPASTASADLEPARPAPATAVPAAPAATAWAPDDAVDLLSVAGPPVLRRAAPVAAAAVLLALVAVAIRRRRHRAS